MLICKEYKNCKEFYFECIHRKPHSLSFSVDEEGTDCRETPCSCEWTKTLYHEVLCVDHFIVLMEKAIDKQK